MKKFITSLLFILCVTTLPSFAKDEKCVALSNLASTIYRNKATVNEYQMLRGMEFKSKPIDFAFVKLFSGVAYTVNTLSAPNFQVATDEFCQRFTEAALVSSSQVGRVATSSCEQMVAYSNVINTFRQSGDTPASLRRHFDRTFSENNSFHRLTADYLNLMSEMRFSNLFAARSDADFLNFSKQACEAFGVYLNKVEKSR
jgi:hypothetical protein